MKKAERKIKFGDVYYYDFGERVGSMQSGKRPVIVLQADEFNMHAPTILVAPLTSVIKKRYLPSHIIVEEPTVFRDISMILVEQLCAVNKELLLDFQGCIENELIIKQCRIALKKAFGMWNYKLKETEEERCWCYQHMHEVMELNEYSIRRKEWNDEKKEKCEKCNAYGRAYILKKKILGK